MGVIGPISQLQREVFLAQRATFSRYGLDAPSFDVLAALRRAGQPYQLTPTALMRTARTYAQHLATVELPSAVSELP